MVRRSSALPGRDLRKQLRVVVIEFSGFVDVAVPERPFLVAEASEVLVLRVLLPVAWCVGGVRFAGPPALPVCVHWTWEASLRSLDGRLLLADDRSAEPASNGVIVAAWSCDFCIDEKINIVPMQICVMSRSHRQANRRGRVHACVGTYT